MFGQWVRTFRGVAFVAFWASACQQAGPPQAQAGSQGATERVRPTYDKGTGQLKRLEFDSDGDGTIDTWGYMDGSRVLRVEVDEDRDGKVDRWEFHGDPASTPTGEGGPDKTIERIERATHHDGRVSRWEYFDGGSLTRVEEDTDGDGKVDKWETYVNGALSMMALDTERRGAPDRRLIYRVDGTLDRIETDPTGSGRFQPLPR